MRTEKKRQLEQIFVKTLAHSTGVGKSVKRMHASLHRARLFREIKVCRVEFFRNNETVETSKTKKHVGDSRKNSKTDATEEDRQKRVATLCRKMSE